MVVGAYTIINTIGLLVGLPGIIQRNTSYDINKTFSGYLDRNFVSNNVLNVSSLNHLSLIVDFDTSISTLTNSKITITSDKAYFTGDNYFVDFTFTYSTKVDNYCIYTFTEGKNGTVSGVINFDWTSDYSQLSVNQVYFASLTSSLSDMNGSSVINSITSGLGLMGDITTNFSNGFSSLIWNSEQNTLTTFGNFSLIFLGVSITFAIVKLCLNLIRSKTGA